MLPVVAAGLTAAAGQAFNFGLNVLGTQLGQAQNGPTDIESAYWGKYPIKFRQFMVANYPDMTQHVGNTGPLGQTMRERIDSVYASWVASADAQAASGVGTTKSEFFEEEGTDNPTEDPKSGWKLLGFIALCITGLILLVWAIKALFGKKRTYSPRRRRYPRRRYARLRRRY